MSDIPVELPTITKVQLMAERFFTAQEVAVKAQGEVTQQLAELKFQEQKPLVDHEQYRMKIQAGMEEIRCVICEYLGLFDQSIGILTSLQEDPTIHHVEAESCALQ